MKKLFILFILFSFSFSFVSCSSGWSCQKRYVDKAKVTKKAEAVKYRQC